MKGFLLTLNLIVLFLGSGCQVKKSDGTSGNLISNHEPVTNSFVTHAPTSKTYVSGETLSVRLTFPFNIVVTGTPRLNLTIGSTTRYANYTSGHNTPNIIFTYTITGADNDTNGVALNSLDLNGGTLTFDANGVSTNCNIATVTAKTWSGAKVDNTSSAITAFALTNIVGLYHKDQNLNFTMTYDEPVYVTGTPRFALDFTVGGPVYAHYVGGSGTTTLSFSFTIDNTVVDTNGYDSITSPIDLNGGTIKDGAGNNAGLTFAGLVASVIAYSAGVDIDGQIPYLISVTPPAVGTYLASQNLDVVLEFDRDVNVTGSPYIDITIGSTVRQATYFSGSGTETLVFRYTTVPGDTDSNGIAIATTVTQNAAAIGATLPTGNFFAYAANNLFTSPITTGVIVNAIQPMPISVTRNTDITNPTWGAATPDNRWMIGQTLTITVGFNTPMYVSQIGGTPRIPLTIGVTTQYATYLSGGNGQTSLVFSYTVQVGDLDSDGSVAIGSIQLNGGSIVDVENTNSLLTLTSSALLTTYIDGVRPTISSVTKPTNGTYSTITGNNHLNMNYTVNWSEAVNYSTSAANIPVTIGVTPLNATYTSGNNTATIIHQLSSLAGLTDTDGVVIASPMTATAVIKDIAGNTATVFTFAPPVSTAVLVDTTAPTVVSVTPPAAGTYNLGGTLNFAVTFSEIVNVTSSGGYPRIALAFDSGIKYATYLSGTGTTTINFRYTVVATDSDINGITNPTTIQIANAPTAYIRDVAWNNNTTTSYAITTNLAGVVVDAVAPTISSRTIPANGTYTAGTALQFTTTYTEAVTVTGTPRIAVTAQTGTLYFDYVSGTGTTVLTYRYTVTSSDFDFDGLPTSITTVALNGGTIQDAQTNNAALTFTAANLSSVFLAYPNTVVWTTNTFTNRAAAGGITLSSGGAVTSVACGTSTCRVFNGDDSLSISAGISGVETVFMVFKTPAALANLDLFATDISVTNDGIAFDLTTASGTCDLDGASSSGTTHNFNMGVSTVHIMQMDFSSPTSYGAGLILRNTYLGAVGDVIIVNGALSGAQKAQILTYLNTKY